MRHSTAQATVRSPHDTVASWYRIHGRHHLPWRNTSDPYHIYLSETMLQQTQVATVERLYYPQFLHHFPTLQHLAHASLEDVLKQWQGLGYYRRAKHLHHTAQACTPALPSTEKELMALKGIGRNTAHAILAFAHRQPVAIMEANVKRILTRVYALTHPTDTQLWQYAHDLLDTQHPYEWNQAMMDIGASICTPKAPHCTTCPLTSICNGKGAPTIYPAPKAKKTQPTRLAHIVIMHDTKHQRVIMQPRQTDFLHGLYGFLEQEAHSLQLTYANTSVNITSLLPLGNITQIYSHFTLKAQVWLWNICQDENITSNAWHSYHEARQLPMSRADSKALQLFLQSHASDL
jgi:A/G-specific adenine glycosylase